MFLAERAMCGRCVLGQRLECFDLKLGDPTGGCDGSLAGDWCSVWFGETDAWIEKKLRLHPKVKEEGFGRPGWLRDWRMPLLEMPLYLHLRERVSPRVERAGIGKWLRNLDA